jgi:hypothetical protein
MVPVMTRLLTCHSNPSSEIAAEQGAALSRECHVRFTTPPPNNGKVARFAMHSVDGAGISRVATEGGRIGRGRCGEAPRCRDCRGRHQSAVEICNFCSASTSCITAVLVRAFVSTGCKTVVGSNCPRQPSYCTICTARVYPIRTHCMLHCVRSPMHRASICILGANR